MKVVVWWADEPNGRSIAATTEVRPAASPTPATGFDPPSSPVRTAQVAWDPDQAPWLSPQMLLSKPLVATGKFPSRVTATSALDHSTGLAASIPRPLPPGDMSACPQPPLPLPPHVLLLPGARRAHASAAGASVCVGVPGGGALEGGTPGAQGCPWPGGPPRALPSSPSSSTQRDSPGSSPGQPQGRPSEYQRASTCDE